MENLPVPRSKIIERLKKMEGQTRGVQKMVEEKRECVDIMVQLAAIRAALESVAGLVLRNYSAICVQRGSGDIGSDMAHAVSLWIGGKAGRAISEK